MVSATPTASATALKKRRGCFTSVTGATLPVFVVYVVLNPWALHFGGRWTPAMTWHGVGKRQSTSGANYGLFIEVNPKDTAPSLALTI